MNKKYKTFFTIMILIIILFTISNTTYGISTNDYDPGTPTDTQGLIEKAVPVIKMLLTLGIIVGVVGITLLGLRYMLGSVQEKAEYKETMMPFIFGAVFMFSVCTVLRLIAGIFY